MSSDSPVSCSGKQEQQSKQNNLQYGYHVMLCVNKMRTAYSEHRGRSSEKKAALSKQAAVFSSSKHINYGQRRLCTNRKEYRCMLLAALHITCSCMCQVTALPERASFG